MTLQNGDIATKRSGMTGKTRQFRVIESRGERVLCIADDNGKIVIVSRRRLHSTGVVLVSDDFIPADDSTRAIVERLLAERGTK